MPMLRELVEDCKDRGFPIRKYGTWFHQIRPDKHAALNFWGDPRQDFPIINSNIHNHDTSFTSTVLLGETENTRYQCVVDPHGDLQGYNVNKNPSSSLQHAIPSGDNYCVVSQELQVCSAGMVYVMAAPEFHITVVKVPTITQLNIWRDGPFQQVSLIPQGTTLNTTTTRRDLSVQEEIEAWLCIESFLDVYEQTVPGLIPHTPS